MASKQEYEQREKSLPISPVRFVVFFCVFIYTCAIRINNALCYFCCSVCSKVDVNGNVS